MAEINLTQPEANALIAMEKHRADDKAYEIFAAAHSATIPLHSADKREHFLLDVGRGTINLAKIKMQNRARRVVVLVRLDLAGPPHRNPNDEEIACPHLHIYREGFADKWAVEIPGDKFGHIGDLSATLDDFMAYCNITRPPLIARGLLI